MDQTSTTWQRSFVLATLAGVLVVTMGGTIYGRLTQRWGAAPRMKEAGARLLEFPERIGEWELQADIPVEENVINMLACDTFVNRRYVNRTTGDSVTLSLFVGPAGPTAVHTPEVCLSSREYVLQAKRKKEAITPMAASETSESVQPEAAQEFWGVTFDSRRMGGSPLRVYYAWTAGDHWEAPEHPRFEYGAAPMLYKIQVAGDADSARSSQVDDPCREFLQALVSSGWKLTPSEPVAASPSH
jgi:hypothetical protein